MINVSAAVILETKHAEALKPGKDRALKEDSRLGFIHRFEPATNTSAPVLLLLHGSGGDENSLLSLGRAVAPGAALLSPRGKVADSGSSRFFERWQDGAESEKEVEDRTAELSVFLAKAIQAYKLHSEHIVLVGFSAGASIGVHLLLQSAHQFSGAVLMRGKRPFYTGGATPPKGTDLQRKPVLLLSGIHDPLVQSDQAEELAVFLREAGASVTLHWEEVGHVLSQGDVLMAFDWVRPFYAAQRPTEPK